MATNKRGGRRFLATVLFTDIVDSTRVASERGDAAWRRLLAQHHELVRRQLRRFDGREVDTAGDGFFAVFDAPARAVGCALAIAELVDQLGIGIRAGVHMGEVEEMGGGRLGGIGVHIGARISAAAEAGEVLVSATVRDLVAGSGIDFVDRGVRELKGVSGEWRVYAASQPAGAGDDAATTGSTATAGREIAAVRRSVDARARRRRLLIPVALLVAIALVGVTAFVVTRPPPSLPAVGENAAGVLDAATGRIVAQVSVGARPAGVGVSDGAVWIANHTDDTVSRIDPRTRTVVQTVEVGDGPSGISFGFGSVWVANSDARSVSRINVSTNRVVQTITVGNGPSAVAAGADAIWVTNSIDGTLTRIDPSTGTAGEPIGVGASPTAIAADGAAVWVANLEPGTVSKVDGATGRLVASVGVGNGPRGIAIGDGAVWVANSRDGTVSRIDAASGRVTATVPVGEGAASMTVGTGVVWVAAPLDGAIYRIDSATNTATRLAVGAAPQEVALAGTELWFSARASASSHRGGTVRVVSSGTNLSFLDSIDPAIAYSATAWQILSLTNDGLVGYERTGGLGGNSVVPNLAIALPQPTDGGTTYTFQLRPDLTYSNGEPIRPEDFRRALERGWSVPTALMDVTGAPYFGGIVGAQECSEHVGDPCDLSAGIVTDASTVTIRLTAPDPEFLIKLALPFAVAVPASAPDDDIGDQPLPATGAYMIASISTSEIRVVRNPRFREWNRAARPDGFPDEITWTIGPTMDDQIDLVMADGADVMWDRADAARMTQVQAQLPGQVFPYTIGTVSLFMNTTAPPFNDVNVRRAVNLAVDRGRVVEMLGGPLSDSVTCQVIPPNTAGFAPYCPYTVNPNPAGTWTAPDVAAARDLLTTSGALGQPVTVGSFGRFLGVGEYFVELLDSLGFEAESHPVPDPVEYFDELFDPVKGPQIEAGIGPWILDYPAASSATTPYRCGDGSNLSKFCDPGVQALIDSALSLQQTDPVNAGQRWSEVDRAIVDLAPVAPLTNIVFVDFVSARVGNYQRHPQFGVMLDQLWVQ